MKFLKRTVHQDSFRDIICIMTRHDMIHVQHRSPTIECLSSEHSTKCAVIFPAYLGYDSVHCPSV